MIFLEKLLLVEFPISVQIVLLSYLAVRYDFFVERLGLVNKNFDDIFMKFHEIISVDDHQLDVALIDVGIFGGFFVHDIWQAEVLRRAQAADFE